MPDKELHDAAIRLWSIIALVIGVTIGWTLHALVHLGT